jgi:hypothetical protein
MHTHPLGAHTPPGVPHDILSRHIPCAVTTYALRSTTYALISTTYALRSTTYRYFPDTMMWHNAGRFIEEGGNSSSEAGDSSVSSDSIGMAAEADEEQSASAAPEPTSSLDITRRSAAFGVVRTNNPTNTSGHAQSHNCASSRDISAVQNLWCDHASEAGKLYPPSVWRLLNAVKGQSKITQSKVLQAVIPMLSVEERRNWPKTRSILDSNLLKSCGSFHPRVTRRVSIGLSHIGLPALRKPIQFTFIDPIFAWAECADKLSREHNLYFKYKPRHHPVSGELLYGTSDVLHDT